MIPSLVGTGVAADEAWTVLVCNMAVEVDVALKEGGNEDLVAVSPLFGLCVAVM